MPISLKVLVCVYGAGGRAICLALPGVTLRVARDVHHTLPSRLHCLRFVPMGSWSPTQHFWVMQQTGPARAVDFLEGSSGGGHRAGVSNPFRQSLCSLPWAPTIEATTMLWVVGKDDHLVNQRYRLI